jgi:hypothetical protein
VQVLANSGPDGDSRGGSLKVTVCGIKRIIVLVYKRNFLIKKVSFDNFLFTFIQAVTQTYFVHNLKKLDQTILIIKTDVSFAVKLIEFYLLRQ